MKAELIAVGTEILLGQITDTNTPFIAQKLANLGIDVYFQSTVGDNPERLKATIELAAQRSGLIILSGGLGPTEDDLTKQTVADFLQQKLVTDAPAMAKIERYFRETGRVMTENNRIQAMYLANAQPISNRTGFAVGIFAKETNGPDFLLLPGPPSELEPMVSEQVLPLLTKNYFRDHILHSRVLRFFGIGESELTTQLSDLIDKQKNPTIAPYAKQNEVTLRLTARGKTVSEVDGALNNCESKIQKLVGDYFYGYGDHNSLSKVVIKQLKKAQSTVSAVEGFTDGRLLTALTESDDNNQISKGGRVLTTLSLVTDQNDFQTDLKSKKDTEQLAKQIKQDTNSNLGIAVSQAQLDQVANGEQVGSIWIAIVDNKNQMNCKKLKFSTIRPFVKERVVMNALSMINQILK
ncbi:Molybdopterin binding motif, CinA N-terminal domain [Pediococcus damnosus]|uniref:Putative competence-damage inducible protein n=1 Tax=Pediococcus damnosus TaxID=51663 RepID=A0A143AEU6_9LACO|nr:competence/damage-inducible protein A [Pediococcus damnosus]AMV62422.1 Molybdopterin binding motif, CinA N-terminal domain [Pediococcus damnosus]AMV67713.1 Molybdopterin binding motif, CinA N-terminal domain [Pediococcus damnosus]PJE49742.1 competence/damage-inducible protein A [Pediococcus damnosus]GEA92250.1 putative competence-damage inducible protein [Pediococcus damnosus]